MLRVPKSPWFSELEAGISHVYNKDGELHLSELLTQGATDPGPKQSTEWVIDSLKACQSATETLGVFYHLNKGASPWWGAAGVVPVSARLDLSCQPPAGSLPLFKSNRQKSLQGKHRQQALSLLRSQGARFPAQPLHLSTLLLRSLHPHRRPSHQLLPPTTSTHSTQQASWPCQALARSEGVRLSSQTGPHFPETPCGMVSS